MVPTILCGNAKKLTIYGLRGGATQSALSCWRAYFGVDVMTKSSHEILLMGTPRRLTPKPLPELPYTLDGETLCRNGDPVKSTTVNFDGRRMRKENMAAAIKTQDARFIARGADPIFKDEDGLAILHWQRYRLVRNGKWYRVEPTSYKQPWSY